MAAPWGLAGFEGCTWEYVDGRAPSYASKTKSRQIDAPETTGIGAYMYLLTYGFLVAAAHDARNGMACYYLFETREAAEMYVLMLGGE